MAASSVPNATTIEEMEWLLDDMDTTTRRKCIRTLFQKRVCRMNNYAPVVDTQHYTQQQRADAKKKIQLELCPLHHMKDVVASHKRFAKHDPQFLWPCHIKCPKGMPARLDLSRHVKIQSTQETNEDLIYLLKNPSRNDAFFVLKINLIIDGQRGQIDRSILWKSVGKTFKKYLQPTSCDNARVTATDRAIFQIYTLQTGESIWLCVTSIMDHKVRKQGGGILSRFGVGLNLPSGQWNPGVFYRNADELFKKESKNDIPHRIGLELYVPSSYRGSVTCGMYTKKENRHQLPVLSYRNEGSPRLAPCIPPRSRRKPKQRPRPAPVVREIKQEDRCEIEGCCHREHPQYGCRDEDNDSQMKDKSAKRPQLPPPILRNSQEMQDDGLSTQSAVPLRRGGSEGQSFLSVVQQDALSVGSFPSCGENGFVAMEPQPFFNSPMVDFSYGQSTWMDDSNRRLSSEEHEQYTQVWMHVEEEAWAHLEEQGAQDMMAEDSDGDAFVEQFSGIGTIHEEIQGEGIGEIGVIQGNFMDRVPYS